RELDLRFCQGLVEHVRGRSADMETGIFFCFPPVDHHRHAFKADHEVVRLPAEIGTDAVARPEATRGDLLIRLLPALLKARDQLRQRLLLYLRLAQHLPAVKIRIAFLDRRARVQGIEFERFGLPAPGGTPREWGCRRCEPERPLTRSGR